MKKVDNYTVDLLTKKTSSIGADNRQHRLFIRDRFADQHYPRAKSSAIYAGHHADLTQRYDIAKTKTLMKAAGYEKGFSIDMATPIIIKSMTKKRPGGVYHAEKINITAHQQPCPKRAVLATIR